MYTEVITGELRILQSLQSKKFFVLPSDSKCTFVSQPQVGLPTCVSYYVMVYVCVSVCLLALLFVCLCDGAFVCLCVCVYVSVSMKFRVVIT